MRRLPASVLLVLLVASGCSREPAPERVAPATAAAPASSAAADAATRDGAQPAAVRYQCPMHPQIVRDAPGKCPICGMTLLRIADSVDANASAAAPPQVVTLAPSIVQNLGVRIEAARRGVLQRQVSAVGVVAFDPRRIRQVRPRADGWVEGLTVHAVGDHVSAGQRLFSVYSPTLVSAQQEYRDALEIGNPDLIEASRDRLRALGVERSAAAGRVAYVAPTAGVVTELGVHEGARVTPDMMAITINEAGSLWILADLPESQAGLVATGGRAELRVAALPGQVFEGRIEHVNAEVEASTRTVRARIVIERVPAGLKPNMLVDVQIDAPGGAEVVHVPRSAVIRGGREDRVIVALGDGRFTPRTVVVGEESGDRIALLSGLEPGTPVVVAGQFLIDSEANLGSAMQHLDAQGSAAPDPHAGHR